MIEFDKTDTENYHKQILVNQLHGNKKQRKKQFRKDVKKYLYAYKVVEGKWNKISVNAKIIKKLKTE